MAREKRQSIETDSNSMSGHHKLLILVLFVVIVIALIAHVIIRPDRNAVLKIVYTGNLQGQIEYSAGNYAGYEKIAAIAQEAESDSHVLLLSTGDDLAGNELSEVGQGSSIISIMNAVGYASMVPGNADFIYGTSALSSLRAEAKFPFLAANIKKADGTNVFENYQILNINSVRIGVIGVTTGLGENQAAKDRVIVEDPVESVKSVLDSIAGRTDAVIILAYTNDDSVATDLANVEGVSLVIESGSSSAVEKTTEDGKLILSAGEKGKAVGVVELDIQRDNISVVNKFYRAEDYDKLNSDSRVSQTLTSVRQNKAAEDAMEIGSVTIEDAVPPVDGADETQVQNGLHNYETAIGNLTADAMLDAASADSAEIALIRDASIQGTLKTGTVTRGEVAALFDDNLYMTTCRMTGGEVRSMLEDSFLNYPNADKFLQVSGISYVYDPSTELGTALSEIMVGDHRLDDARTYIVAMPNTLADELGYSSSMTGRVGSYQTLTSVVVDHIQHQDDNISKPVETGSGDEGTTGGTTPAKRINIIE